jgi:hypothetical protein
LSFVFLSSSRNSCMSIYSSNPKIAYNTTVIITDHKPGHGLWKNTDPKIPIIGNNNIAISNLFIITVIRSNPKFQAFDAANLYHIQINHYRQL